MPSGGGGRGGGYGGQQNANTNANQPIVTTNSGGGTVQKKGIIAAVSEIQQYSVMERGQDIPGEFLTLEGSLDYFRVGAVSGFSEGIILFILFPFMEFYLFPFVLGTPDKSVNWIFSLVPFCMIALNTLLCFYVSKFYIGKITRKAINNLFVGRSMSLLIKGCIIFVLYYMASKMGKPKYVWAICKHFGESSETIYYNYFLIQPKIIPAGLKAFTCLAVAAMGPYGFVFMLDWWRQAKIRRNLARVTGEPFK